MIRGLTTGASGLVAAALVALAVLVWPGPPAVRRWPGRPLRSRPPATGSAGRRADVSGDPFGPASSGRADDRSAGSAQRSAGALPVDLLMELVACGLRSGMSVVDALAATAAVGAVPRGLASSSPARVRRHRVRALVRRLAQARRSKTDPTAYLGMVVARLRMGVPAQQAWARPPPALASLAGAMVLAELSGAPAAAVVTRAAADARADARERVELAAARLGVRLVLPLGLAVLPGFVLLAVVPIVLGLASSVLRLGA
jgi:hypothetical protein